MPGRNLPGTYPERIYPGHTRNMSGNIPGKTYPGIYPETYPGHTRREYIRDLPGTCPGHTRREYTRDIPGICPAIYPGKHIREYIRKHTRDIPGEKIFFFFFLENEDIFEKILFCRDLSRFDIYTSFRFRVCPGISRVCSGYILKIYPEYTRNIPGHTRNVKIV